MEFIIIGAVVVVALVIYFLSKKSKTPKPDTPNEVDWSKVANGSVPVSMNIAQTTFRGAQVFSPSGVSETQLILIDDGLMSAFADARISGYTSKLEYTDYEIYIPKYGCVPSPVSQVPSFMVRGDSYDGTPYDVYNPKGIGVKDGIGVVYAAEMVLSLGLNGEKGKMICCADMSVLENATRYGAEHIIIKNNDPLYYEQTWFHETVGHPLLPKKIVPQSEVLSEVLTSDYIIKTVK